MRVLIFLFQVQKRFFNQKLLKKTSHNYLVYFKIQKIYVKKVRNKSFVAIPCHSEIKLFFFIFFYFNHLNFRFNSPSILEGCTKDWKAKYWTVKDLLEIEDGDKVLTHVFL